MLTNKLTGSSTAEKTYVEDVFSTYLYTGNGSTQTITNGIQLGSEPANGTILHLTGDTLTDSAPIPTTLTVNGNTSVNTSVKKYGTGSLAFDGSGDYITTATTQGFNASSGDWTIEAWMYCNNSANNDTLITGDTSNFYCAWLGTGFYLGDGVINILSGVGTKPTNQWFHFACVKSGSTYTAYINGVSIGSSTTSLSNTTLSTWTVGYYSGSSGYMNGYIDDLRITKGHALYTTNFTPPSQALPLDTLIEGKGGMVWVKARAGTYATAYHGLFDTARGAGKYLGSNVTNAQSGNTGDLLSSFNSNGFSVNATYLGAFNETTNGSSTTYTSWTFRKAPKFFDVVTWTGNGVSGRNISHSLGQAPGMIIVKSTDGALDWRVYHRSTAATSGLVLNTTAAKVTTSAYWNNTEPTSTAFTVGNDGTVNGIGYNYVAYLFAHDTEEDGMIKCGSFTASALTNVNLGWEPQYILIKMTSGSDAWYLIDNMRGASESGYAFTTANTNLAESTGAVQIVVPTATGFKFNGINWGDTSSTFIYMAIRRPMKVPTDGTKVFQPVVRTGSGASAVVNTTITPDLIFHKARGYAGSTYVLDRLRDNKFLNTQAAIAETTATSSFPTQMWDSQAGYDIAGTGLEVNSTSYSYIDWAFKRAPGFFDVVCYTGDGVAGRNVNHNLGGIPELIITKRRSAVGSWFVDASIVGASKFLTLDSTNAAQVDTLFGSHTSTTFQLEPTAANTVNSNLVTYVAYLFASCPGVSKVGTVVMSGSSVNVDCGFTNGARFVLLKNTTSTSNWWVYDTARGIIEGVDPYLALNSTAAEASSDDIDPYAPGFKMNNTFSNGTWLYLAIA